MNSREGEEEEREGEAGEEEEEEEEEEKDAHGSVRFGCLFTRKPGLGYSRGDKYSQAGGWTIGYPLITPESSRGVPTTQHPA